MPRARIFDTEEVLQSIMHLFWRKGYDNTSLVDLERVSSLKRPSLYNAFENKEELFKRALQTYLDFIESQNSVVLIDGIIESIKNMFIPFTSENFSQNL